ncbi:hypothetical protein LCGC14_1416610 [marine sediment metagenome]|uniref:Uncharacterized protein n=1 Tax=marine sediment metagenome TaxID=412755 RepID=A0A0F9M871_9ZZZZ
MPRLEIEIDMNNAPFQDDAAGQVVDILSSIILRLEDKMYGREEIWDYRQTLIDTNGNSVGQAVVKPDIQP